MTTFNLEGKRAIITGAARGLGKPVALAYVKAGAKVLFTAMDQKALDEAVEESGGNPENAIALSADLRKKEDIIRIVETARDAFGGIDILFNNAGVGPTSIQEDILKNPPRFWEYSLEDYRWFFEVNTLSALQLSCLVAPEMVERGWGRIFCDTTSLDTMLRAGMAPYGGSKSALEAMTAVMAGDLEGTGVTANVLVPGGMADTRMLPDSLGIPRDQMISPQAMVAPALWLGSELSDGVSACRFIAAHWDTTKPLDEAVAAAKSPIAWKGYGVQGLNPK